jgi:hypothetical protein
VVYGERLGSVVEKLATKGAPLLCLTVVRTLTLRIGARVYIDGSVRTRRYTDALGNERSQTEVVLQPYSGEFAVIPLIDGSLMCLRRVLGANKER